MVTNASINKSVTVVSVLVGKLTIEMPSYLCCLLQPLSFNVPLWALGIIIAIVGSIVWIIVNASAARRRLLRLTIKPVRAEYKQFHLKPL